MSVFPCKNYGNIDDEIDEALGLKPLSHNPSDICPVCLKSVNHSPRRFVLTSREGYKPIHNECMPTWISLNR